MIKNKKKSVKIVLILKLLVYLRRDWCAIPMREINLKLKNYEFKEV